jgi:hypothetical protein
MRDPIETRARDLCTAEGWDPDEIIACAPEEVVGAQQSAIGKWSCRRWQAYARAAEKMLASSNDDWTVF